jgi:hypothetical protein
VCSQNAAGPVERRLRTSPRFARECIFWSRFHIPEHAAGTRRSSRASLPFPSGEIQYACFGAWPMWRALLGIQFSMSQWRPVERIHCDSATASRVARHRLRRPAPPPPSPCTGPLHHLSLSHHRIAAASRLARSRAHVRYPHRPRSPQDVRHVYSPGGLAPHRGNVIDSIDLCQWLDRTPDLATMQMVAA